MAWRIVKQPNGKYARFSEVVDDFTHGDMTREEALELCREYMGRQDAERKVKNADDERDPWTERLMGAGYRFEEAVKIVRNVHGEDHLQDVLKKLA